MMSMSRRDVMIALGALGGCALGVAVAPALSAEGFFLRHKLPVGLQLYTVEEDLRRDFDGTLAAIAKIGYRRVELAGSLGHSAADLRSAFDRAGLQCDSAHIPFGSPGQRGGDSLEDEEALIASAGIIGWRYIVVPMFPIPKGISPPAGTADYPRFFEQVSAAMTADAWRAFADRLNEKAARLARAHLKLGYHNHNVEFAPVDDTTGYQILMERTDPTLVTFEMDAGWVAAAGLDPLSLLKRYPRRYTLMHMKDIQASSRPNHVLQMDPVEIGYGHMDWVRILPAAYQAGIREFFVEQEPPFSMSRLAAIEKSYRYLADLKA